MSVDGLFTNVKDFGATGDGSTDDTKFIQAAVDATNASGGGTIFVPSGTYIIDGVKNTSSVYNNVRYGIQLYSNLRFIGSGMSSIVKLKNNSTADTTLNPFMFLAGPHGSLSNIAFENMSFYGNSKENVLNMQPSDQRNVSAIYMGGFDNGEGVTVDGFRVVDCLFTDWPGANVIVVHDRKTNGSFSHDVLIDGNTFYDNRKADGNRDHSTVNIFADNTRVVNNQFALPDSATILQKQMTMACELHGSASCFNSNTLDWYSGACIFSENLHHDCLGQSAVGNICSNMTYRVFDIAVSGQFKTINQVNVIGNTIHFNTIEPIDRPYGAPYKWAMSFYIENPAVVDSLTFAGNIIDGNTLRQRVVSGLFNLSKPTLKITVPVTTVGIAGLWGGGGDLGLTHLNVIGNEFRRLRYGVWQDRSNLATFAKHSSIVGNRFENLASLATADDKGEAVGVFYTLGKPAGVVPPPVIHSVNIAHNHFVNDWNHKSYKYGTHIDDTIFFPSIGENWYYQIKGLNNGWGPMSTKSVISRPAFPNAIFASYGKKIIIDWGKANRFYIEVTDSKTFTISTPNVSGTTPVPADATEIEITLLNKSGGSMGNVTWGNGYKTSWNNSLDKPANKFNRTLRFRYSCKFRLWLETSKTPVDVPN